MSITLNAAEEWALGLVGLPWPDVDEDQLREYAEHVRAFASSLSDTHGEAHTTITNLSAGNAGPSYEALIARWGHVSSSHMHELIEGCHALATGLDVAAEAVTIAKGVILGAVAVIAVSFVADTALAIVTFGAGEAIEAGIIAAARTVVKSALDQLEQMAISEGLELAIGPLEDKLAAAVQGMVLHSVDAALE